MVRVVRDRYYFVYIMTNEPFGTLYIGVTNNLHKRIGEHKDGSGGAFTKKYKLTKLVYFESFPNPTLAIQREKTIKRWSREWKLTKINEFNPDWKDLYEDLNR